MIVYEISHTLNSQSEYVAANSPVDAVKKLKEAYKTNNFPEGRLNDEDILSIIKLGDLVF